MLEGLHPAEGLLIKIFYPSLNDIIITITNKLRH